MLLKLFTVGSINFSYRVSSMTVQRHTSLLLNRGTTYEGHYFMCLWITTRHVYSDSSCCVYYSKYKGCTQSNTTLQCHITMFHMFGFIITIIRHIYYKSSKKKFICSTQILCEISLIYKNLLK